MHEPSSDAPAPLAIVSGASGAIGRVAADRFADAGWRLALPTRSAGDVLRRARPDAWVREVDLLDPEACRAFVDAVADEAGPPHAVLNFAGGFGMGAAAELTDGELRDLLDVNLHTLTNLTGAALPGMLARGRGHVLGVSAGAALDGGRRVSAYAASKAAVAGYLRSLRAEVEPRGLDVSMLIVGGTVDTPANRRAMPEADANGWIEREALAEACLFLVRRGRRGRVFQLRIEP